MYTSTPQRPIPSAVAAPRAAVAVCAAGAAALLLVPLASAAAPGELDPAFGSGGVVVTPVAGDAVTGTAAVSRKKDGAIFQGAVRASGGGSEVVVLRFDEAGSPLPAPGANEVPIPGMTGGGFPVVLKDRSVLIVGTGPGAGGEDLVVARLLEDGSRDDAFGTGGLVVADLGADEDDEIHGAVAVKGGRVAVCGRRGDAFAAALLEADGAFASSFGGTGVVTTDFPGTEKTARALAPLAKGKLLVVGDRLEGDILLARYSKKGVLDAKLGAKVAVPIGTVTDHEVTGVAVGKQGAITVSGSALTPDRWVQLWQLTKNGDAEAGVGAGLGADSAAASVVRLRNGKGVALVGGGGALRLWGLVAGDVGRDFDFGASGETPVDFGASSRGGSLALDARQRVLVTGASDGGVGLARVLTR
jgi:hypothetical protein